MVDFTEVPTWSGTMFTAFVPITPRGPALQRCPHEAIASEPGAVFADFGELRLGQLLGSLAELASALR
jgi:hypothetical protein